MADPRILRLIQKWLRAGVSEQGTWSKTTVGTPQGSVVSPFLANVYLHYVSDLWVHQWRKKHATGEVRHLERALTRWACRKYKRLRRHYSNAANWLGRVARRDHQQFVVWQMRIRPAIGP